MAFDQDGGEGGGGEGRGVSIQDLACVAFFLHAAESEGLMLAGHRAEEAFDAMCRLVQLPPEAVRAHLSQT